MDIYEVLVRFDHIHGVYKFLKIFYHTKSKISRFKKFQSRVSRYRSWLMAYLKALIYKRYILNCSMPREIFLIKF